jgi:hypothetical protein
MITLIYRKTDNVIGATVHPRRTPEQSQDAVESELQNILNSELGGVASDYAIVETELVADFQEILVVNDGVVSLATAPKTSSDLARERKKAKRIALGLTEEEVDA